MIKCTECGYENLDGLDYCDGCGGKLPAAASAVESGASAAQPVIPAEPVIAAEPMTAPAESGGASPAISSGLPAAEVAASEGAVNEGAASRAPTGELKTDGAAAPATAAGAPFKAKLTLTRGSDRRGQEFELESGKNYVGRWDPDSGSFPEVDLEQDDPEAKISRKHALIIVENGKITVEDIGSLNGTYVNRGQRLVPATPVELHNGDEIIIGKTFLKLTISPIS